jgi:hypothetical protein
MSEAEHIAVTNFRTYLRIKTVQPKPDYESCTAFLKKMAEELDLGVKIFEVSETTFLYIISLTTITVRSRQAYCNFNLGWARPFITFNFIEFTY